MLRAEKYLTLTTLISVLFLAASARAGNDQGSQFSLSLDAQGESLVPPSIPLLGNRSSSSGIGGAAFADWRPVRFISFGVGAGYFYFPSSPAFKVSSFDLGGRIFPFSTAESEVYFQGGVGRNLVYQYPSPGHYHGYAGVGYRKYLSKDTALDAGIQYDFFSPISEPSAGIGAKVGITFLFGRERWPVPSADFPVESISHQGEYGAGSYYTWKPGDTLKSIAAKIFGSEGLYPALVDANRDLFSDTAKLRVGMQLKIPDSNFSDDQLEDIREKAISSAYYRLEELSSRIPYDVEKNWKGPHAYVWKTGDDLKSVAGKIYDDEDLYPILVDANKRRLIHPVNLVPGVVLLVPAPPKDEWTDAIHERAQQKDYYIWWKTVSENK